MERPADEMELDMFCCFGFFFFKSHLYSATFKLRTHTFCKLHIKWKRTKLSYLCVCFTRVSFPFIFFFFFLRLCYLFHSEYLAVLLITLLAELTYCAFSASLSRSHFCLTWRKKNNHCANSTISVNPNLMILWDSTVSQHGFKKMFKKEKSGILFLLRFLVNL